MHIGRQLRRVVENLKAHAHCLITGFRTRVHNVPQLKLGMVSQPERMRPAETTESYYGDRYRLHCDAAPARLRSAAARLRIHRSGRVARQT
jgi:hypothetical protein